MDVMLRPSQVMGQTLQAWKLLLHLMSSLMRSYYIVLQQALISFGQENQESTQHMHAFLRVYFQMEKITGCRLFLSEYEIRTINHFLELMLVILDQSQNGISRIMDILDSIMYESQGKTCMLDMPNQKGMGTLNLSEIQKFCIQSCLQLDYGFYKEQVSTYRLV